MDDSSFECAGLRLSRLWICFGSNRDNLTAATIRALLEVAQTNVLPVNTHRLTPMGGWEGLELGYGGVWVRDFAAHYDASGMTLMLNTNHARSAAEALSRSRCAYDLSGVRTIKLEVLNDDFATSNQGHVVEAARALLAWNRNLLVLPLLGAELDVAKRLLDAGCPLLRVMGSPIGSRRGIDDPAALEGICRLGVPVILDGGVGGFDHVRRALDLGVSGVLVNSMLYGTQSSPVDVLRRLIENIRPAISSRFSARDRSTLSTAGALHS
jgi:thiazole synthase